MARNREQGPDRFPTTRWSLVARVGDQDPDSRRQALAELATSYLPAMRTHLVYRKGLAPERADDLLQEFVTHKVLEKDLFAQADRGEGRFRTFLLTALDRFLFNWHRNQNVAKRTPEGGFVAIDDVELECVDSQQPPSDAFDVAWARQVIDEALGRLRADCEASGRQDMWRVFDCRVVGPILEGKPSPSYRELVERFGFSSPTQASNTLVTAKRMFARALRVVIGHYANDEEEIDAELTDLQTILARCGNVAV